nr:DUF4870 domain-containing protein [Endozoicomonas sp. SESOKO1]
MNDSGIPPMNMPDRDDKNMAVLAHLLPLSGFMVPGLNIAIPLVIWLMKRKKSLYIEHHARESLNFQITVTLLATLWIILKLMLVIATGSSDHHCGSGVHGQGSHEGRQW